MSEKLACLSLCCGSLHCRAEHYRKNVLYRDPIFLPRAKTRALGKHRPSASDRIAVGLHLGKQQLSAKWAVLPRAALGKKCPSAKQSFTVGRALGKIRLSAKHCRGPIAVTCPDGVTALPRASPLLLSANLFAERRSRQIFAESPSQALGKCGSIFHVYVFLFS